MAHVRFTADYDYRPSDRPRVVVAYKAGMSVTVKRECADDAIAKGRAVEADTAPRERTPREGAL